MMDKEMALKMVVELLGFDVNDKNAITSVRYLPGEASVLSRVGSVNKSGNSVNYSEDYFVVDKSGNLYALKSSEFQVDKNFENFGKQIAADPICIKLSKLRVEPAYIILYDYLAYIDTSRSPERKMTIWSF